MSLIGNISIRLKLHRKEVGFYKGKHSMSCNCQLLPTVRDGIKWIYAKETKRRKEKEKMVAAIRLVLKQCLLIQFLDYSSSDNVVHANPLDATNYDVKSMGAVTFLLLKKIQKREKCSYSTLTFYFQIISNCQKFSEAWYFFSFGRCPCTIQNMTICLQGYLLVFARNLFPLSGEKVNT